MVELALEPEPELDVPEGVEVVLLEADCSARVRKVSMVLSPPGLVWC